MRASILIGGIGGHYENSETIARNTGSKCRWQIVEFLNQLRINRVENIG